MGAPVTYSISIGGAWTNVGEVEVGGDYLGKGLYTKTDEMSL